MATLLNVIKLIIAPYNVHILIAITLILFIIVLVYYNWDFLYPTVFDDVANADKTRLNSDKTEQSVVLTLYHVKWCPHSTLAKSEFDKFNLQMNDNYINGYKLQCVSIDCEEVDASGKKKYNGDIESFPTIKLVHDGNEYEFQDDFIDVHSLTHFVESVVGQSSDESN